MSADRPRRLPACLLAGLLLGVLAALAPRAQGAALCQELPAGAGRDGPAGQPPRIGEIIIRTEPLFTAAEAAEGRLFRVLNALHSPTQPQLIRAFLLFHEGDAFNPARLVETERNLRQLDFLRTVEITASPPHDGLVDVTVASQDSFTTNPDADFSHVSGFTTYEVDVTQKNLLGTGAELTLDLNRTTERVTRSLDLATPALFSAYWNTDVFVADSSDGGERRLTIARPYFSYSNRWQFALEADELRRLEYLYNFGATLARFRQRHRAAKVDLAYAVEATAERSRRVLVGYDLLDDRFRHPQGAPLPPAGGAPAGLLPQRRNFRYLMAGYQEVAHDFVKLDYVDQDEKVEDFNLGRQITTRFGFSARALDPTDHSRRFQLDASRGWRLGRNGFLLSHLAYDTRWEDRTAGNEIATAALRLVQRVPSQVLQTLVGRIELTRGWHLDRDVQFIADGLSGLRAFPIHAYGGDRRLLINLEDRFFLGREVMNLFAPGAAFFFDAGAAPQPGKGLAPSGLKSDLGAGLRVTIPRLDSTTIRFDCAYRLNGDPTGRRGFVLTAGTTQAF